MKTRIVAALALLALPLQAHAETPEPVTLLKPLAPWQVDFGPTRCRAIRSFGSAEQPSLLIIDQYAPKGRGMWTVAGAALRDLSTTGEGWEVVFAGPEGAIGETLASRGSLESFGNALVGNGIGRQDKADETYHEIEKANGERVAWVDVKTRRGEVRRLATGRLGNLFAMMKRCSDDIVRVWGLDPAVEAGLTRQVKPLNGEALTRAVIAKLPMGNTAPGDLSVRVMVDSAGKPTECKAEHITIARNIDNLACPIFMEKGQFAPALDANGVPVASYWQVNVLYRH